MIADRIRRLDITQAIYSSNEMDSPVVDKEGRKTLCALERVRLRLPHDGQLSLQQGCGKR